MTCRCWKLGGCTCRTSRHVSTTPNTTVQITRGSAYSCVACAHHAPAVGLAAQIVPLVAKFREFRDKNPTAPLFRPLLEVFWKNIVVAWFMAVSEQFCNLANPLLLRYFLASFNADAVGGAEDGYKMAVLMLLLSVLQTFVGAQLHVR